MDLSRTTLTLLGIAILVVAGWLAAQTITEAIALARGWDVRATVPWIVGDSEDPFAYAGGVGVRAADGDGHLQLSEGGDRGLLRVSLELVEAIVLPPDGRLQSGSLTIRSRIDDEGLVGTDALVNGATDLAESRLPTTRALVYGSSRFDLVLDGSTIAGGIEGTWILGHALRKDDGAIRNQGLVFSPLLRDDTVFSDPNRLELTLLLYEPSEDAGTDVALHVVFRDLEVLDSPLAARIPDGS